MSAEHPEPHRQLRVPDTQTTPPASLNGQNPRVQDTATGPEYGELCVAPDATAAKADTKYPKSDLIRRSLICHRTYPPSNSSRVRGRNVFRVVFLLVLSRFLRGEERYQSTCSFLRSKSIFQPLLYRTILLVPIAMSRFDASHHIELQPLMRLPFDEFRTAARQMFRIPICQQPLCRLYITRINLKTKTS